MVWPDIIRKEQVSLHKIVMLLSQTFFIGLLTAGSRQQYQPSFGGQLTASQTEKAVDMRRLRSNRSKVNRLEDEISRCCG